MEKIGEGYYYKVYDLGNGRVLKKKTNHFERLKKAFKWYGKTPLRKIRVFLEYPLWMWREYLSLRLSVKTEALNPEIFGNPVFIEGFEYEQDRAIILEDYFKTHTLEENQTRFDEYISLLHKLWTYGISETVFNFTINTGISFKTDKLIYVDFNEFKVDKEIIEDCIKIKKWLKKASIRDMSPSELKNYIVSKMDKEVTLENLEKLWGGAKG